MKIHANLKWTTIVNRLNKKAGFEKYRYDSAYKKIYELNNNAYFFISDCLDKESFLHSINEF
jgi:hypothetical protein